MRHRVNCLFGPGLAAAVALAVTIALLGGSSTGRADFGNQQKAQRNSGSPPPLVVNKDSPLLLQPPPEEDPFAPPPGPTADNSACLCCHINYQQETLALDHAKVNIGCVKCHGESQTHRNDENNITPPEIMFPPEKIDPQCKGCHTKHDAPAAAVITRWQQRGAPQTDPLKIVCTDCHGEHRLKHRTVRWDKRTGKLLGSGEGNSTSD